jgi:hypothetical protein
MALLAHWRYRSDAWRRRGNRVVHAPAPAPSPQQLALAAHPAPRAPPTLSYERADCGLSAGMDVSAGSVWLHLRAQLLPLCAEAERLMAGPAARALATRDAGAAAAYACHLPLVLAAVAHMSVEKGPKVAALLCEARAHGAAAAAARPAALLGVESVLAHGVPMYEAQAAESAARVERADATLAEVVWHSEMLSLQRICGDVCARLAALLAHSRRASPAVYADVGAACAEALVEHARAALRAHAHRAAWMADAAAAAGGGATPAALLAHPEQAHAHELCIHICATPPRGAEAGGGARVASCA